MPILLCGDESKKGNIKTTKRKCEWKVRNKHLLQEERMYGFSVRGISLDEHWELKKTKSSTYENLNIWGAF